MQPPRIPANPEPVEVALSAEELSASAQLARAYPSQEPAGTGSPSPGASSQPRLTNQEFLKVCGDI